MEKTKDEIMNKKPKQGFGFIYKYTSPNGKSYIGQTVNSLKNRADKNGRLYKGSPNFYFAIQKHGFDNFKVEILEECKKSELDKQESYWIDFYNTIEKGYNIKEGGSTCPPITCMKVAQYDLDGNLIQTFNSMAEASRKTNISNGHISKCVSIDYSNTSAGNFMWRSFETEPLLKIPSYNRGKAHTRSILIFDKDKNFIKETNTVKEAAEFCGVQKLETIYRNLKNQTLMKWKYYVQYKDDDKIEKKVNQYDLDGNLIQTFNSPQEACEKFNNLRYSSSIYSALRGYQKTAYEFLWEFAE